MKKILTTKQTQTLDAYTIQNEPIRSIDLMERASHQFCVQFELWYSPEFPVHIFCGKGNNGGDGLAVGRILQQHAYDIHIWVNDNGKLGSKDFENNLSRLPIDKGLILHKWQNINDIELPNSKFTIIDALFGSGLTRPLDGIYLDLVKLINSSEKDIVSIDIPSGMFADQATEGISIHADYTISFELPKLGFFFSENAIRTGTWVARSIGLHQDRIDSLESNKYMITFEDVKYLTKDRDKFGHKGNYGHICLITGSRGKVGASILSARAALRTGAGLLTVHIPECAYNVLQTAIPEAMVDIDKSMWHIGESKDVGHYSAIGIGPGLGTKQKSAKVLEDLIKEFDGPLVLDADALNIIADNNWTHQIPGNSIITPHPGEFRRLFGEWKNDFEKNEQQIKKSIELGIYIVLKGAFTCITTPDGSCYFNSSGNPGMATAGSGDVLTGILTSLLGQGYDPFHASIAGVYLHGLAGDISAEKYSQQSMIAGDIIENIGCAYQRIKSESNA
jgi:NAD(P)H-hydrate epimerase